MSEYWRIFVDEVVPEIGIEMTDAQKDELHKQIVNAHDNYGTMHGHDCIPNPNLEEISRLAKQLDTERRKVI